MQEMTEKCDLLKIDELTNVVCMLPIYPRRRSLLEHQTRATKGNAILVL